ncbi:MAG: anaerobic ribonucleoside-triphosphate reductase activating protein [Erysipelotrichaceae bacterium]|jgi:anaerobic ribonucleoside-triphosphate reductase activating protein
MNYLKIESSSLSNGLGWRVVLWVSGCSHKCFNCHNPETWDSKAGKKFTETEKSLIMELLKPDYIRGLTLSGGDPLFESNRTEILKLVKEIKQVYPKKDIWLYTGYRFEQIKDLELLKYIDVLVDGQYVDEKKDITLAFRGSDNQKIIDVVQSIQYNKTIEMQL